MFEFLKQKVSEKNAQYLVYALLALFTFAIFYTAWVVEDAFITFRTVDNFWNGYGLRWNIDERVMTYTHPLWMLLLLIIRGISNNLFIGSLILCFIFTFLTIRYLVIYKKNYLLLAIGLLALLSSRAFIDYSTSGLENPLVHFLILTLIVQFLIKENKNIAIYSLIVGLILLTRLDLVFFVLPICFYVFYFSVRDFGLIKTIGRIFLGAIPFFSWCLFATYYYGSFIPNTAWAKLNHGISKELLWHQSYLYFSSLLKFDTLTFFIIILIPPLYLFKSDNIKIKIISISCLFGLFYVFNVGSDYMLGRFVSVYFLVSIVILVFGDIKPLSSNFHKIVLTLFTTASFAFSINTYTEMYITLHMFLLFFILIIVFQKYFTINKIIPSIALLITLCFFTYMSIFGFVGHKVGQAFASTGITDERFFYAPSNRMLNLESLDNREIKHQFVYEGLALTKYYESSNNRFFIWTHIGMTGYSMNPKIHLIDPLGLGDPFLAQYPMWHSTWRIGHHPRYLKDSYIISTMQGKNLMKDEDDRAVLNDIWLLSKAKLNNPERMGAIIRLHKGEIRKQAYKAFLNYNEKSISDPIFIFNYRGNWESKKSID